MLQNRKSKKPHQHSETPKVSDVNFTIVCKHLVFHEVFYANNSKTNIRFFKLRICQLELEKTYHKNGKDLFLKSGNW